MHLTKFERAAIAGGQRLILVLSTAMPHRPHGMDHMPRGKPVAFRDFGVAGSAAAEAATFGQKFWPGGAVDGAIDAAAAEQRAVRSVDDGVNVQGGDVG